MGRGPKWSEQESRDLAIAYMTHSIDAENGTDQKGWVLWNKVSDTYSQLRRATVAKREFDEDEVVERTQRALKGHWKTVQSSCLSFMNCYNRQVKAKASGTNSEDWFDRAAVEYKALKGSEFKLRVAWEYLSKQEKFRRMKPEGVSATVSSNLCCVNSIQVAQQKTTAQSVVPQQEPTAEQKCDNGSAGKGGAGTNKTPTNLPAKKASSEPAARKRPEGQKKAKANAKAKAKKADLPSMLARVEAVRREQLELDKNLREDRLRREEKKEKARRKLVATKQRTERANAIGHELQNLKLLLSFAPSPDTKAKLDDRLRCLVSESLGARPSGGSKSGGATLKRKREESDDGYEDDEDHRTRAQGNEASDAEYVLSDDEEADGKAPVDHRTRAQGNEASDAEYVLSDDEEADGKAPVDEETGLEQDDLTKPPAPIQRTTQII